MSHIAGAFGLFSGNNYIAYSINTDTKPTPYIYIDICGYTHTAGLLTGGTAILCARLQAVGRKDAGGTERCAQAH